MSKNIVNMNSKDKSFYSNILKNNPNDYEALLKLGLIDVKEKNFLPAKEKFKQLIKLNIFRYEGHLNLSNIYCLEGDTLKANKFLEDYLINIDENIEIINAIAINLLNLKKYNDLEKYIKKYINKCESYILYYLKGYILTREESIHESEKFFKKSIGLNANFWQGHESLLKQYEKQSRIMDLKNLVVSAKKLFKNNIILSYYEALYFFRIKDYLHSLNILNNKETYNKFLSTQNKVALADYFHLLCRVNEKLGFYNESYNFAIKRNNITLSFKENKKFKKELILDTITVYKNFFDNKNKTRLKNNFTGINHSNLAFLIGFPRSGTTLLDTILRSHSKTLVLEERSYLLDVRHKFFKKNNLIDILQINQNDKIKMQEEYFSSFDYQAEKVIIDKYPLNLIELGFIKTIFPESKIILAIRHPLDCIISCILTSFKMNDGMVNFENIHTTSHFYNECFDLLFKYFYFYDIDYHVVKYENVIRDFKAEIRKLTKFLNLNFEENINNFHITAKNREKINTPSYDQVVQPIYSSSVNRYKNFDEIRNIKTDINRWIKEFSY